MIDTIRVKYQISPTSDQLQHWTCSTISKQDSASHKFFYNPVVDNTSIRYTYYPISYDGKPSVTIEFSFPKLVFGNNFTMILDLENAVELANKKLSSIPYAPQFNLWEGILIRLDVCFNHQVGNLVFDYKEALSHLEYPHRKTVDYSIEGVEFKSRHIITKFYDKQLETSDPQAYGILRQETTINKGKEVQKKLGKPAPTLQDITTEWVVDMLNTDLEKLKLKDRIIADRDTALSMLSQKHGADAGIYYWGVLILKTEKPKKIIKAETHIHPRSLDRRLKKIADTGIALTITKRSEPLPPLIINL